MLKILQNSMSTGLLIIFGCPVGIILGTGLEITEARERFREAKCVVECLYVLSKYTILLLFRGFLCVKMEK